MSAEVRASDPTSPYELYDDTITDPLREDPFARVAYSSNPRLSMAVKTGFNDFDSRMGASARAKAYKAHPIHTAEDSLLARPDVAEALEAVHRDVAGISGDERVVDIVDGNEEVKIGSMDTSLAMRGLSWLKEQLDNDASGLRVRAADTKHRLDLAAQANVVIDSEREARIEGSQIVGVIDASVLKPAEQRRLEKQAAIRDHEAARDAQLSDMERKIREKHPELDLSGFRNLASVLVSHTDDDGKVNIREYRSFALAVDDQVRAFLDDPHQLINNMGAIRYALAFLASKRHRHDFPITSAYVDKIKGALDDGLEHSTYENLDEEIIDRWYSAIDSAEDPEAAAAIMRGTGVLQHSLAHIVHEDPIRYIDNLYRLAIRGLDPAQEVTHDMTLDVLRELLKSDGLAASSLVQGAFFVEDPRKADTQQQAIDLMLTLGESGLPTADYCSEYTYSQLEHKDRILLDRTLLPRTASGSKDEEVLNERERHGGESLRIIQAKFLRKAQTPEGESTLLARLTAHRNFVERSKFTKNLIRRLHPSRAFRT